MHLEPGAKAELVMAKLVGDNHQEATASYVMHNLCGTGRFAVMDRVHDRSEQRIAHRPNPAERKLIHKATLAASSCRRLLHCYSAVVLQCNECPHLRRLAS